MLQILLLFGFTGIAYFISQSELIIDLNHLFSAHSLVSLAVIIGFVCRCRMDIFKIGAKESFMQIPTRNRSRKTFSLTGNS